MTNQFKDQLGAIYLLATKTKDEFNSLYGKLQDRDYEGLESIDLALKSIGIDVNDESRYALIKRMVTLKTDSLNNYLKDDINKEKKLAKAYDYTSKLHTIQFKVIQKQINENGLLNEFYRTVLDMYIEAGEILNKAQPKWKKILDTTAKELKDKFGSDGAVLKYLDENNLFDLCKGKRYDHCYSLLSKKGGSYKSYAYIDLISEIEDFVKVLDKYHDKLKTIKDDEFNAEEAYLNYIKAVSTAFSCRDTNENIELFKDADRAWMQIDTPIQPTHPFEYYEDKYRSAVALEFDIRIDNPYLELSDVRSNVTNMYTNLMKDNGFNGGETEKANIDSLNKTQLHLSKPLYHFAAQFDGLFSAQVVPNDPEVTKEYCKKIFASIDFVYEIAKNSPELEISHRVLPKEFLDYNKNILLNHKDKWYQVYNIETIGHEFGHILYVHDDSEIVMNKSGVYKYVEEFKATTGGLVSYFKNKDRSYDTEVFYAQVERAVMLIGWMEVHELVPYYCEGLIHLYLLFKGGILSFDGSKLNVTINSDTINSSVEQYLEAYNKLALHYLNKKDSLNFLSNYAVHEKDVYLPKDPTVRSFVDYYYDLYGAIGNKIHID